MTWAWGEFHDEMVMMMMLRRRVRVILSPPVGDDVLGLGENFV